jgi:hypothetical protein
MSAKSKLLLLLTAAMTCALAAGCSDDSTTGSDGNVDSQDFSAEESFYYRIDLGAQAGLELESVSGEITITGVAGSDSIVISGVRRVRSESTQDAEEHLDLLEVNVQDLTNRVFVETVQPQRSYGRSYEVDYDIILPADLYTDIDHVNGQILLDGLTEGALIDLVNGLIEAEVTIPSGGAVDMDVVNGGIQLDIPKTTSADFSATVVNGSINVTGLTIDDLVSTSTSITGTLGTGDGTVSLSIVNGNINVVGVD